MHTELPKHNIIAETEDWQAVYKAPDEVLPQGIYPLDLELSGIVLYAKNPTTLQVLRNAYGSQQFTFQWTILAMKKALDEYLCCELPIAKNSSGDGMRISHRFGKKSKTIFRKLKNIGTTRTLWSAETHLIRPHQIRIHAHEVGIPILGESFYDAIPIPLLSDLKSHTKANRKGSLSPIYPSIMIHLHAVSFSTHTIDAPLPDAYAAALKIIERWS